MKKIISLFTTLCIVFGVLGTFTVFAEPISGDCGAEGASVTWALDDDGIMTISGAGEMENWTSYSVYPPWKLSKDNIKKVIIESGVTSIGDYAFKDCKNLTEVTLPEGIRKIGTQSFSSCTALVDLTIPDSVTYIGQRAFDCCKSMSQAHIGTGLTVLEDYVFSSCESLSELVIPNNITQIKASAFRWCESLTSIIIPDSVTELGEYAFANNSGLTSVSIGNGITKINDYTFRYCSLTSIEIPNNVTEIGQYAFADNKSAANITIGSGTTVIGEYAFSNCENVTDLYIPSSIVKIDRNAFARCKKLAALNLPDSIVEIGKGAFQYCESLTEVVLPDSITALNDETFLYCKKLQTVTIGNSVKTIGEMVFRGCSKLATINMPVSVTEIVPLAFNLCSGLKDVNYAGNKEDWEKITIGDRNDDLLEALTHCADGTIITTSTPPPSETAIPIVTEISTLAGLEQFCNIVNSGVTYEGKTVKLTADIDMSAKYGEGKESWTAIGTENTQFKGVFDGQGHTINGLYINNTKQYQGLFGYVRGTVTNLMVDGSVSSSSDDVGGIVGCVVGTVSKCGFSGTVSGKYNVGGIIGWINGGQVSDCNNSAVISAQKGSAGGVVGYSNGGTLTNCHNTGSVSGKDCYVGGVAGNINAAITNCSNKGAVSGTYIAGGIAGNSGGTISSCYNIASVTGSSGSIGGVVGVNWHIVTDCYNKGEVAGTSTIGGIIGDNSDTVTNCYNIGTITASDTTRIGGIAGYHTISEYVHSEMSNCFYLNTTASGGYDGKDTEGWSKSLTDVEFADKSNFENWDFETVWEMDETLKRPVLQSNREAYIPYEIDNVNDLIAFRNAVNNGHSYEGETVTLNADIDLSTVCGKNINGKEISWEPISDNNLIPFIGTFDGGFHKITGLYSTSSGLFMFNSGTIQNVSVSGEMICQDFAGGIVGENTGKISRCSFSGSITGGSHIGGIAGMNIAMDEGTGIFDCYNTATVNSNGGVVGGIAGLTTRIERCYNIGNIQAEDYFASIAAGEDMTVTDCYYLIGTADKGTEPDTFNTTALTSEQFADKTNFANWDFDTVWKMDETLKRPVLRSGTEEPPTQPHTHKICGDANCTDNHEDIEWTEWNSETSLPTEAGNYYLTKDVTLYNNDWSVDDEPLNLCLNGHVITAREYGIGIGNDVILTDCSDTIHRFTSGESGVWVLDEQSGTETVTGGVITGFADDYTTQSLIVIAGGCLDMYNINVTGNKPSNYADSIYKGGGITNRGILNMHSGKIIGNGAGVYNFGIFNMTGGEITDNVHYGGVHLVNGTMTIGGTAVIKDNKYNLFANEKNISVDTDNPLKDGAYIGIGLYSYNTAPTEENPVDITGENDADYSKYFHSDDENYKIINGENNVIQLVVNDDKIKPYMSRMFFSDNNIKSEKVTSLNQLKELVYEQCDYDGIAEKYDEAFFNDKFLYLYRIDDGSSGNVYNITSAENAENSINIAVTQEAEGDTDDIVQWFLVVEIDRDLYNKDININFTDLQQIDYSIKYENGKAVVTVPQDGTYTVIFAAYDNGRLLSVNAQDIQLVKGENSPISPQNFNANGKVKVMLWDSLKGMKPLCEPYEKDIN